MNKTNLSEKTHWQSIHQRNDNLINIPSNLKILQGYYHFALFKIIKKFWNKDYNNFLEIGCAPGNYLVKFKKTFKIDAFGVEYEKEGYLKTIQNVSQYGIPEKNIVLADFFDSNFLQSNYEKFNIVFSAGFIEHFQDPKEIIKKQASLLAKNGLLICIIPNARYAIEFLSDKKTISLHNQSIMNPKAFRDFFDVESFEIEYCNYFGGLFNFGIFGQKKFISKIIFKSLFVIQRLILDNLEKIYFMIIGRDLTCKYTSPSLLCIAIKK